jgi:hypothetical protein
MPLDLLATTLLLAAVAVALRGGAATAPDLPPDDLPPDDLPPDDLPPATPVTPLPRGPRGLRRYVGRGLSEIDAYLSVPADLLPGSLEDRDDRSGD